MTRRQFIFSALACCLLAVLLGSTAGNGVSVTTSQSVIFDATTGGADALMGPCMTFMVKNRSASTGNVLVNVQGLHAGGEWVGIAPGDPPVYFRFSGTSGGGNMANGIAKVTVKTDSSTATIDYGKVAQVQQ